MGRSEEIYLDIETDGYDLITVIGFDSEETGVIQLHGGDVTRKNLLSSLPRSGRLFTFNGERFDIPKIDQCLRVDLTDRFESCDLMKVGWTHDLQGGQKLIEDLLGFERSLPGLNGLAAIEMWKGYVGGDESALTTLLEYNGEDLSGMRFIKQHLQDSCCLTNHGQEVVRPPRRRKELAAVGESKS